MPKLIIPRAVFITGNHTIFDATIDSNHRLERLYDAIETGKMNLEELVPRIRELQSRQEQLQTRKIEIETQMSDRRVELVDLETTSGYVDDLHELLNTSPT
jgi:regulator of replication initiation timing